MLILSGLMVSICALLTVIFFIWTIVDGILSQRRQEDREMERDLFKRQLDRKLKQDAREQLENDLDTEVNL